MVALQGPPADTSARMLLGENYAPYNFLTIFSDGFIAIWLLVLLYLCYRWGGFEKQGSSFSGA